MSASFSGASGSGGPGRGGFGGPGRGGRFQIGGVQLQLEPSENRSMATLLNKCADMSS